MLPALAPALIGGTTALIGGLMGREESQAARTQNAQIADADQQLQKEFATMGIRWKVEDAKAAGIHPLAALGAPTASYMPSGRSIQADNSMGDAVTNMGQDISRAMLATATEKERQFSDAMKTEQLTNARLQNELLSSQISQINRPSNPPLPSPMSPMGTSSGSGGYVVKPSEITSSAPGVPEREAGAINDYSFVRTKTGLAIVPSKDAKERIEDQFIPEMMWSLRNQIIPNFTGGPTPPGPEFNKALPRGANGWVWSYADQEFQPARNGYPLSHWESPWATSDRSIKKGGR